MPIITGSITIADLLDGVTGASVLLTNEVHTFVADAEGAISASELSAYNTDIRVFVGADEYTYTSGTPSSDQFSVGTITYAPSGTDITATVAAVSNQVYANLTIADAGALTDGFDDTNTTIDSMTITLPITVNIAGDSVTVNKVISLTKAKGGDAKILRVTPSRQTMEYAFGASAPKSSEGNIVFTATFLNYGTDSSNAAWTYSVNGGSFSAIDADAGTTSGTNLNTLTVSPTQFDHAIDEGTEATYVTYRATRSSVFDQVTVVLLRDAEGGYSIILEVIDGLSVFRNDPAYSSTDSTTYCDVRARVYRGGVELTSGLTYQWKKNGTNLTNSDLDPSQPANYGVTNDRIRVGAQDIGNNGSELFECEVNTGS